ncbi:MAG: PhoD-like phosphatase N-terminal domain-containing protein [Acidimicrobiales bacterium]
MPPDHAMSLNRRMFLALLGAGGAAAALNPRWFARPALGAGAAGRSGVPARHRAGRPASDGTVIWTSVDPASDPGAGVAVRWEVAADEAFTTVLASGTETATAAGGHTIHAVVSGLPSDGWFHYRFTAGTNVSRTGGCARRRRPDRRPTGCASPSRPCQQTTAGYYVAHVAMAAEDLDFVVHYGDYVYVSDDGTITIDDYRGVYRRFKANPYLQELHARYPMVVMWDDGEFVNGIDRTMEPVRLRRRPPGVVRDDARGAAGRRLD